MDGNQYFSVSSYDNLSGYNLDQIYGNSNSLVIFKKKPTNSWQKLLKRYEDYVDNFYNFKRRGKVLTAVDFKPLKDDSNFLRIKRCYIYVMPDSKTSVKEARKSRAKKQS